MSGEVWCGLVVRGLLFCGAEANITIILGIEPQWILSAYLRGPRIGPSEAQQEGEGLDCGVNNITRSLPEVTQ